MKYRSRPLYIMIVMNALLVAFVSKPAFPFADLPLRGMVNMVDFGAKTCVPCKMMEPVLQDIHRQYKGVAAIVFVDVTSQQDLARKHRIYAIPTQIFFDQQGKEVYRHVGFLDKNNIIKQLEAMGVRQP